MYNIFSKFSLSNYKIYYINLMLGFNSRTHEYSVD